MISVIGLEFGGVMHSTMKQIAIEMGLLGQYFSIPRNFPWNFSMIGLDQD